MDTGFNLVCHRCDKPFYRTPSRVAKLTGKKPVFCSFECSNQHRVEQGGQLQSLVCCRCRRTFQRRAAEVKRQKSRGVAVVFCSAACSARGNSHGKGNAEHLRSFCGKVGRKRTAVSPFRPYLRTAMYRHLHSAPPSWGACDLTLEYLLDIWTRANGLCPYTGLPLVHRSSKKKNGHWNPMLASLDRVDNSKGYVQGNIRFVSLIANVARNQFSDQQLVDFCRAVVAHTDASLKSPTEQAS